MRIFLQAQTPGTSSPSVESKNSMQAEPCWINSTQSQVIVVTVQPRNLSSNYLEDLETKVLCKVFHELGMLKMR